MRHALRNRQMERTIQLASPKVLGPIFVKEEVVLWNTREL